MQRGGRTFAPGERVVVTADDFVRVCFALMSFGEQVRAGVSAFGISKGFVADTPSEGTP